MIITEEIIEKGKSLNGGWSEKQLRTLGTTLKKNKGWKKRLLGLNISEANVKLFLNLKDKHLVNKETGEIKIKYLKKSVSRKEHKFAKKNKKREPKPLVEFWVAVQTCGFIKKLLGCNQGLNQWEIDFIDKLQYHERFSIKQAALIAKLRQKVFDIGFLT